MIISGRLYKYYPVIDLNTPSGKVATLFRDTLCISNLYLQGLGADYDGDQMSARGVWDVNANRKCDKSIYEKKNFLNISGQLNRTTEKEAIQTIYSLTCNKEDIGS